MTTMEWGALGQMLTGMIVGPSQCVLIWYGIHKIGASGFRVGCPTPLPCDEVHSHLVVLGSALQGTPIPSPLEGEG